MGRPRRASRARYVPGRQHQQRMTIRADRHERNTSFCGCRWNLTLQLVWLWGGCGWPVHGSAARLDVSGSFRGDWGHPRVRGLHRWRVRPEGDRAGCSGSVVAGMSRSAVGDTESGRAWRPSLSGRGARAEARRNALACQFALMFGSDNATRDACCWSRAPVGGRVLGGARAGRQGREAPCQRG